MKKNSDLMIAVFFVGILLICFVLPWIEIPVVDPFLRHLGETYPRAYGVFLVAFGAGLGYWDYTDAKAWRWMENREAIVCFGVGVCLMLGL